MPSSTDHPASSMPVRFERAIQLNFVSYRRSVAATPTTATQEVNAALRRWTTSTAKEEARDVSGIPSKNSIPSTRRKGLKRRSQSKPRPRPRERKRSRGKRAKARSGGARLGRTQLTLAWMPKRWLRRPGATTPDPASTWAGRTGLHILRIAAVPRPQPSPPSPSSFDQVEKVVEFADQSSRMGDVLGHCFDHSDLLHRPGRSVASRLLPSA